MIYLASCYLAGYPPCLYIEDHKRYIENYMVVPVIVGTHPMPQNYVDFHDKTGDWYSYEEHLENVTGDPVGANKYDSTRPDYAESLKK